MSAPAVSLCGVPGTRADWHAWVRTVNPGEVRRRAGVEQRDLAARLGVTPNALGYWERGLRTPRGGKTGTAWFAAVTAMSDGMRAPAATPAELRLKIAALLPGADADLVEALAAVAGEHAEALLGGRHPSCARWLPQARSTCGLAAGHLGRCLSVAAAGNQRMRAKKRAVRLEAGKAAA